MKYREKQQAVKLREQGASYSDILSILSVSKGTLSKWLKSIPITNEQKKKLRGRAKSRYAGAKANQAKALNRQNIIFKEAKANVGELFKKSLFLVGLMLYWAEGTKNGSTVAFTNSDPRMIKLMMCWFREICVVPEEKFRILVFIHSLQVNDKWRHYWSGITGVSEDRFIKPYIKPSITKHRRNKLYNGTCAIRISSVDLMVKIKGWLEGALEIMDS
ncbi:MAG: helix-turn-helix domain-containing protein [bacterium]